MSRALRRGSVVQARSNRLFSPAFGAINFPYISLGCLFCKRLVFLVTLRWTSVGGFTDNSKWEDTGKRLGELSARWPSVGGVHAGSDRARLLTVSSTFLWILIRRRRRLASFSYECLPPLSPSVSCPLVSLSFLVSFSQSEELDVTELCRFSRKLKGSTWLLGVCVCWCSVNSPYGETSFA